MLQLLAVPENMQGLGERLNRLWQCLIVTPQFLYTRYQLLYRSVLYFRRGWLNLDPNFVILS